jgi:rRNA-processing protein FCF1
MRQDRLFLKDGVDPDTAASRLRDLVGESRNLRGRVPGTNVASGIRFRDLYIDWVDTVEKQISDLTLDPEAPTMLHTPRYWRIREIDDRTTRVFPLIESEIDLQAAALERLAADLDQRARRARTAPGDLTVLDTNVLLHYQPPEQIPWPRLVGCKEVRLVIPLRVLEELDAKKYASRSDLADRARRLLPQLERVLGPAGAPGPLADGVTIEVPLVDDGRRLRTQDADDEILETCRELGLFTGKAVSLVTADTAMRLRAQSRGLRVVCMPHQYARKQDNDAPL